MNKFVTFVEFYYILHFSFCSGMCTVKQRAIAVETSIIHATATMDICPITPNGQIPDPLLQVIKVELWDLEIFHSTSTVIIQEQDGIAFTIILTLHMCMLLKLCAE